MIGVVTSVNGSLPVPSKAKKAHYSCCFELVDESGTKLVCTILDSNEDDLPKSLCCGDVLCLRKVAMELFEGKLAVKTSTDTAWMLFRKQEDFKPSYNFTNISMGPTERGRLADLRDWLAAEAGECHAQFPPPITLVCHTSQTCW